jgi:hypothetical protein
VILILNDDQIETDLKIFKKDFHLKQSTSIAIPELDYFAVGNPETIVNNLVLFIFQSWNNIVCVEDEYLTHRQINYKLFLKEHFKWLH